MGPGDKFSEDSTGQILYIDTAGGRKEIARRASPDREKNNLRFASRVGTLLAVPIFILFAFYFLGDLNNLVADSRTHQPIPWSEIGLFLKILAVAGNLALAAMPAIIFRFVVVMIIVIIQAIREMPFKEIQKTLKESENKTKTN